MESREKVSFALQEHKRSVSVLSSKGTSERIIKRIEPKKTTYLGLLKFRGALKMNTVVYHPITVLRVGERAAEAPEIPYPML